MIKFLQTTKELGDIKPNTSKDFLYEITEGDINDIKDIIVGCGSCTTILSKRKEGIKVRYKASRFPEHLIMEGINEIEDTKKITVFFSNGTSQVLKFHFKKVK